MIQFTIKQLIPMVEAIDALLNIKMPVKDSYNLSISANIMREKFDAYEKERQELVKKYGDFLQTENVIRVKNENMQEFQNALEGLMSEIVELPIKPISVASLDDHKMTAKDMALLSAFFCP